MFIVFYWVSLVLSLLLCVALYFTFEDNVPETKEGYILDFLMIVIPLVNFLFFVAMVLHIIFAPYLGEVRNNKFARWFAYLLNRD